MQAFPFWYHHQEEVIVNHKFFYHLDQKIHQMRKNDLF